MATTHNAGRARRTGRMTLPVLLPVVLGIGFYLLGVVLPDPIQGQVALGAIGVLVAVTIELILRLARGEEHRDTISELIRSLDRLPPTAYPLARRVLAAYAGAVVSTENSIYQDALRAHAQESAIWLERVSAGELELDVGTESIELLQDSVQNCKLSLRGITIASQDLDWWQSEGGRRYWEANIEAIKRGVKIQRIFIDGAGFPEARLPELTDLMKEQKAAGVSVFSIRLGQVAPLDDPERDITIFDDQMVHEVTDSATGVPTRVTFRRKRDATRRAATHFERVLIRAKSYDPASPPPT
ncbi:hypothetical protein [Paractinoplanes aksuensis]|nr:hypothetical protein [Actinoplanes aksuensis]